VTVAGVYGKQYNRNVELRTEIRIMLIRRRHACICVVLDLFYFLFKLPPTIFSTSYSKCKNILRMFCFTRNHDLSVLMCWSMHFIGLLRQGSGSRVSKPWRHRLALHVRLYVCIIYHISDNGCRQTVDYSLVHTAGNLITDRRRDGRQGENELWR